jgi:hypothetical protein
MWPEGFNADTGGYDGLVCLRHMLVAYLLAREC